jgi:hypothetical protein
MESGVKEESSGGFKPEMETWNLIGKLLNPLILRAIGSQSNSPYVRA